MQSCPQVTFLGPDPAKRWPDPTRDCRQKDWPDPARPDPTHPLLFHEFNIQVANRCADPTRPTKIRQNYDPTRSNPTRVSIRPVDNSDITKDGGRTSSAQEICSIDLHSTVSHNGIKPVTFRLAIYTAGRAGPGRVAHAMLGQARRAGKKRALHARTREGRPPFGTKI